MLIKAFATQVQWWYTQIGFGMFWRKQMYTNSPKTGLDERKECLQFRKRNKGFSGEPFFGLVSSQLRFLFVHRLITAAVCYRLRVKYGERTARGERWIRRSLQFSPSMELLQKALAFACRTWQRRTGAVSARRNMRNLLNSVLLWGSFALLAGEWGVQHVLYFFHFSGARAQKFRSWQALWVQLWHVAFVCFCAGVLSTNRRRGCHL